MLSVCSEILFFFFFESFAQLLPLVYDFVFAFSFLSSEDLYLAFALPRRTPRYARQSVDPYKTTIMIGTMAIWSLHKLSALIQTSSCRSTIAAYLHLAVRGEPNVGPFLRESSYLQ